MTRREIERVAKNLEAALYWAEMVDESDWSTSAAHLEFLQEVALAEIGQIWGSAVEEYMTDAGEFPPDFDPADPFNIHNSRVLSEKVEALRDE
jgi:hypothetical protein